MPLDYPPENEHGVVYLFSQLARRRFGLKVERIRAKYPDCIAIRAGERIRIEFEYRSSNFARHGHNPQDCDWIVCWIHDWPQKPDRLRVVELRKDFGLGFNVWFQPVTGSPSEQISRIDCDRDWSVASEASKGDLVLFYRTKPEAFIGDIFQITGPVRYIDAGWKPGKDWMAPIRRVCKLAAPLHWEELKKAPIFKTAGFVRGLMRGRYKATVYWPELYEMVLSRNPSAKRALAPYGPERVAY